MRWTPMPCSVKGSAANAPCWWQPMAPSTRAQLKRAREEEEERRCRLFLEGEGDGPLLQLCACHGSAKLVHRHCLEKWRRTCPSRTQPTAAASARTITAMR